MKYSYIAIEGNIGAGKTSLARKLAEEFNARLVLESFADNPFLPKFYKEPDNHALPLELFFTAERFNQLKDTSADLFGNMVIADYIFVKSLLFANITLKEDELQLFKKLFNIIEPSIPKPQLILYLHNSVENLLTNIAKRGRSYEQLIKEEYLSKVQQSYLQYFRNHNKFPVLVVNSSEIDFIKHKEDYIKILNLLKTDYPPGTHYITL